MSDPEIREYFMKLSNQKGICGHFRSDQLKEYTLTPATRPSSISISAGAGLAGISLLALLPLTHINARPASPVEISIPQEKEKPQNPFSKTAPGDSLLSGVVTNAETGETIPFVNVVLKDSLMGTTTDFDGRFQFPVPLTKGAVLTFHGVGYEKLEYTLTDELFLNLKLSESEALMGEVVIVGEVSLAQPYSSPRSLWDKLKSFFK